MTDDSNLIQSTENGIIVRNGSVNKLPSNNSTDNNKTTIDHEYCEPPDGGGRAWLVMISAFLCNGILFGVINTYSVIYMKLQSKLTENGDPEASSKAGKFTNIVKKKIILIIMYSIQQFWGRFYLGLNGILYRCVQRN